MEDWEIDFLGMFSENLTDEEILTVIDELEAEGVRWAKEVLQHSPTAIRCLKAGFNAETDGLAGVQELAGQATHLF